MSVREKSEKRGIVDYLTELTWPQFFGLVTDAPS